MSEKVLAQMGLWRHRDFLLLWGGQTVSQLGSQVTQWALPLTAVLLLNATTEQMGLLVAVRSVPYLLIGLFAGVWVDRVRRRPVMIAADIGRAVLLGSIPLAAWLGWLSMTQFYVIGFLTGTLSIFFDAAYQSFLPSLVSRDQLVEGNSKLEASAAVASVAGPGMAGGLVQLLTGPGAILIDALSFVVSVLSLAFIRVQERVHISEKLQRPQMRREISEGLQIVLRQPVVRALAGASGLFNFFDSLLMAVYVLYLMRTIGVTPVVVGVVFALGGVGSLLGAVLTQWVTRAVGFGRALLGGVLLASVAELVIALANGPLLIATLVVIIGEASVQAGAVVYRINGKSLRQAIVPDRLQGRVSATTNIISLGAVPLGALLGGLLGDWFGLRLTVLIAGAGTLLAFLWVLASPVRQLHEQPTEPDDGVEMGE